MKVIDGGAQCPLPKAVGFLAAVGLAAGVMLPAPASAQPVPPDARWYTFETPAFQVVFHEGIEEVARLAAERGERALARLEGFGARPPGRIQMVVADHVDLSNGFARAAPYPRIVIWARPPLDGPGAIPFDDWLELLVTHEVVHILHLEMTGPLGSFARRVFGRPPVAWPFFPTFALPSWAIEGIAVQAESALTDGGRIHGTRFDGMVRARALDGGAERIDQVIGSSRRFPDGERPYAWGGPFHHDLVERYGMEAVGAYFERIAGRINPLRMNRTATEVFGRSLEELHGEWVTRVEEEARVRTEEVRVRALTPAPERITRNGRFAFHPAFHPDDGRVAWMRADGRTETSVVLGFPTEGSRAIAPVHLVTPLSWGPDGSLWTVQPEYIDRYRIRSDLWRIDPDGRVRQVTSGLRATGVDVHAGHGGIVAVLDIAGRNHLALLSPDGERVRDLTLPEGGVLWAHPKWSPDGRSIAVTRWLAGGRWAVGILPVGDANAPGLAGSFHVVDEGRAPRNGATWTPDGSHLLWSSEQTGVSNIFGVALGADGLPEGPVRQVTDLVTGGLFPAVSSDGEHLLFSLLGAEGWDLATLPLAPERWFDPLPPDPRFLLPATRAMIDGHEAVAGGEARPWSPLPTLRPRHWLPVARQARSLGGARIFAPTVGFETWAADPVERNRWDLRVDVPIDGPGRNWEGSARWRWAGLGNPVLAAGADRRWTLLGRTPPPDGADGASDTFLATREHGAGLSASTIRPRFRSLHQVTVDLRVIREELFVLEEDGSISTRAAAARAERDYMEGGLMLLRSTVRRPAFQPGPQEGRQVMVRLRERREVAVPDSIRGAIGRDGTLRDVIVTGRSFHPLPVGARAAAGGAPPVIGLRGAVAWAGGAGAGSRSIRIGGGGGASTGSFGATWNEVVPAFQVRGFEFGAEAGDRAWGAGAELRVPLAILHRGIGILPIHADRLAGALFVDAAGASYSRAETGTTIEPLVSAGAEIALVHTLFFQSPALLRGGLAIPVRGTDSTGARPRPSVYAAMEWAF